MTKKDELICKLDGQLKSRSSSKRDSSIEKSQLGIIEQSVLRLEDFFYGDDVSFGWSFWNTKLSKNRFYIDQFGNVRNKGEECYDVWFDTKTFDAILTVNVDGEQYTLFFVLKGVDSCGGSQTNTKKEIGIYVNSIRKNTDDMFHFILVLDGRYMAKDIGMIAESDKFDITTSYGVEDIIRSFIINKLGTMKNEEVKNIKRKGTIESDNSEYFSIWGSGHPELVITEEVDNQISACPTYAGFSIKKSNNPQLSDTCNMEFFNDGVTPTPERMDNMSKIGKTVDKHKRGASVCGVGQIESTVAGRPSTDSTGRMSFRSVHNNQESTFDFIADGKTFSLTTFNSGPYNVNEPDNVSKEFRGMTVMSDMEFERSKALVAVKIEPYARTHELNYTINGEHIEPISVIYDGIDNSSIKRFEKTYHVNYNGKNFPIVVKAADVYRYVKPNSSTVDKDKASIYDILDNMSEKSCGVFVAIGGVNVITGGLNSWKFIGQKWHSTKTGIRICIELPCDDDLKNAIFAESPNKSQIGITLNKIKGHNNELVFKKMLSEIGDVVTAWMDEHERLGIGVSNTKKIMDDIMANPRVISIINELKMALSDEEFKTIGEKKAKTIFKEAEKVTSKVHAK